MTKPIYSFPEFKEPEKKTAWQEGERKEPTVALVDHEFLDAQRRTALIKERMSPAGALRLPPLLEAHRLKYGIPDGAFASQALFDRIHVFPIDADDGDKAEKTTGGIYKPTTTKLRDKQEGSRGVLVSAGLTAMDRLMSHGVELGDVVITNKNVPFARRCEELSNFTMFYLVMREADLASSESLMERIRAGQRRIVEVGDETGYQHQVAFDDDGAWSTRKKLSVYLNDAW